MRIRIFFPVSIVLVLSVVILAACASAPAAPTAAPTSAPAATKPTAAPTAGTAGTGAAADVEAGKAVFAANCNACHPNGGRGVGPDIKGKAANLVKTTVRQGKPNGMPAFSANTISDAQLEALAAYVTSLK